MGIRKACVLGREILDIAGAAVAVGVTTDAIDAIVHEETGRPYRSSSYDAITFT